MYAIVEIAGSQFKVFPERYIYAPILDYTSGEILVFDKVLLVDNGLDIFVGTPTVNGASVHGVAMENVKGDKIVVFKKIRRKGYKKKQGHRQGFTKLLIKEIII